MKKHKCMEKMERPKEGERLANRALGEFASL